MHIDQTIFKYNLLNFFYKLVVSSYVFSLGVLILSPITKAFCVGLDEMMKGPLPRDRLDKVASWGQGLKVVKVSVTKNSYMSGYIFLVYLLRSCVLGILCCFCQHFFDSALC